MSSLGAPDIHIYIYIYICVCYLAIQGAIYTLFNRHIVDVYRLPDIQTNTDVI